MLKHLFIYIILFSCIQQALAQEDGVIALDLPVRNGLRFNRYAINPTFSFVREQNRYVSFSNKRQWVQFDDAPTTYLFSYSGRFRENIGAGIGLFQQDYGVLTSFGGILNFAYNVVLNRDSNLTFGMNLGFYQSGINEGRVVTNFSDPSLDNIPTQSVMAINPGINYGTAFFDFGLSVNNLVAYNFKTSALLEDNPEQSIGAHVMYTGYMNTRGFLDQSKFSTLIKSDFKKDNTVLSGIVMLAVPKGIWAQVGYNTLYGVSAGIGLNLTKEIALEYNYEQAIGDLAEFGNSHEITLAYKFKKSYRYNYADDDDEEALIMPSRRTNGIATRRQTSKNSNRPRVVRQPRTVRENTVGIDPNGVEVNRPDDTPVADTDTNVEQQRLEAQEAAQRIAEQEAEAARRAEEARLKAEAEAKLKAEQEAEAARLAQEARLKAERERQARLAEQRRLQAEEAARIKAEQEAEQARIAEEARLKAEAEVKLKAEQEAEAARLLAEQEAQAKLAEEARLAEEAEAKAKAEREEDIAMQELDGVLIPVAKDREALEMKNLTELTEKTRLEQQNLLDELKTKVAIKQQDLDDLKEENDLSEQGIVVAPRAFKSITAENREIEALKVNIDNIIRSQGVKITELENVYNERLKTVRDKEDAVNAYYLSKINELKAAQEQTLSTRTDLFSNLETIKVATEIERKRRISRAAYDNEQVRYEKDRRTLDMIRQITPRSTTPLRAEDFDSGEVLRNIQILKGVNNADNGYYLVIAVHSDVAKRDEFLRKAVASGQTNIDFFFDVNSSKYYIYYSKYDSIEAANRGLAEKGSQPYNANMSVVKIED